MMEGKTAVIKGRRQKRMIADDQFKPNKIDEDNLKIFDDSIVIPLKVIGCNLTADEILKEWDALEKNGFPLIHISRLLVASELHDRQRSQLYFLPKPSDE